MRAVLSHNEICQWTDQDPLLCKTCDWILCGWPEGPSEEAVKPFIQRKWELSVEGGFYCGGTELLYLRVIGNKL